MNHIIVAGATGFVGSYLVEELCKRNVKVTAFVRKDGALKINREIENKELLTYVPYEEEILCLDSKIPQDNYDAFVNLAWAGVGGSARSDYKLQLDNVKRSLDFMQVAAKLVCRKFIGISSISEYDSEIDGPRDEGHLEGRHIYATAKLTMHYMAKSESTLLNLEYVNAVLANLYGEEGLDTIILHDTIQKLIKGEPTSFSSGEQMYDFLYIKDAVEGIIRLIEGGRNGYSYYIGSGAPRPLKEYLMYIGKLVAKEKDLGFGKCPGTGEGLPMKCFSIKKIVEHTGYVVKYPFEESIKGVIGYYRHVIRTGEE